MVWPREKSRGWSFVYIRCVPQRITGTTGTFAEAASRVAPLLNSFSSKLRLIVASGKTPTTSPAFRYSRAVRYDAAPADRSTLMWCSERISGPEIRWSKSSRLAMKRTSRRDGRAAKPPKMKST